MAYPDLVALDNKMTNWLAPCEETVDKFKLLREGQTGFHLKEIRKFKSEKTSSQSSEEEKVIQGRKKDSIGIASQSLLLTYTDLYWVIILHKYFDFGRIWSREIVTGILTR